MEKDKNKKKKENRKKRKQMGKGHTFRVRPHQVTHSTIQRKFLESVKLPHITDLGKFGGEATVNTIELVVHQGCKWQGVKDFTAVRC